MADSVTSGLTDGIAIIGMSGRFPKAKNVAEFWQNLRDGVEGITFFSDEELQDAGLDSELVASPSYVKANGVLEGVELFDASFFGFNPREAEILDPQQRLFLECVWETFEDAGYNPETYQGLIGVYAGVAMSTYLDNIYSNPHIVELIGDYQILLGNDKDHLSTYASYKFNLKGPSVAVQTACSTSLVAVCMACQSLLDYQCDMALAGGAAIALPQREGYFYQEGMIMSPDGHCRAFDARAQGTVGGNGLGVVLLKRLSDALADGDYIHAVIKGSAINNDGSLKAGYTAPSVDGQAQVIAMAQAMGGVEAETISYIEAHGTGTPLGDPIEVAALTQAFRARTGKRNFCAIGSVKTNIGHLDTAAGVAGLIKTVLALKHKMIPPSLHFEQPNPKIDFANSPFYVNDKLTAWKNGQTPRRAGVSSFGIGGTNAHVVLEEAPASPSSSSLRRQQLFVVSARTASALDAATANLAAHLKSNPALNLADVAHTLQVGRKHFDFRRMIVSEDSNDAASALETLDPRRVQTAAVQETGERPIIFMFPGQGAQHVNMGLELYQTEPTFRQHVDLCSEFLKPHLGLDLRHVLYPSAENAEEATKQLKQTVLSQPALFVVEYALAKLWMEWGIRPQAMLGHSIGEYVAACLAGVLSVEDALSLVAARGRLMQQAPRGAMLAVPLSEAEVQPLLGDQLSLAAINGPALCVVSGPTAAIEQLSADLSGKGLECSRLHTSHAFHSTMMDPILEPFAELVGKVEMNPPQIPYLSNVTGTWATAETVADPNYWAWHLRQAVRFAAGLEQLSQEPNRIFLEVGPGQTLSTLARQQLKRDSGHVVVSSLGRPTERNGDAALLLTALGRLWLSGVEIDWSGYHAHEERQRVQLPTYPFERQRYWIEAQETAEAAPGHQQLLGKQSDIADWFYVPSWKRSAPPELLPQEELAENSSWLIFSDECRLGIHLAKRLEQTGQVVTTVIAGEEFAKFSEQAYAINPSRLEDYKTLLGELSSLGKLPQKIVHLWSVTAINQTRSGSGFCDRCQDLGFYSLLSLAQALEEHEGDVQISIVSNQVQAVTGEEILCPEKATVLGPSVVIPQEYPGITCRSIDVVIPAPGDQVEEKLVAQLTAELMADSSDTVVAYRGRHRWVQTFEEVRLEENVEEAAGLRRGGVYLITGGMGGVGLVMAEHLARTAQAKLVLVGRSAFPAKDEWDSWLATHDDQDATSGKIRKARELEELGAEVLILSADVSSLEQMQEVIRRTDERFGQLHGVIHAAGLISDEAFQPIRQIDRATCERHFRPKVHGLLVLEKVLGERKLDFCLFTSSLSSILGGLGFVAYAAANIFMDAFASERSQAGSGRWKSVNWDGWQLTEDDEAESGVAELAMTPEEGAEAFRRILSSNSVSQVAVSTGDLQMRINQWVKLDFGQDEEATEEEDLPAAHARPVLLSQYVAPRNDVEQAIAAIWQKLLGVGMVGVFDNFFELGGHSLLAVQLISRLRDQFQVEVTVHDLFNAPTVAELAEKIEGTRGTAEDGMNEIDQMLSLVEQLSEDEIRQLLSE